jgi:hypothetical protein
LADPDLYRSDPAQIKAANLRFAEIEALLLELLARWEHLEGRQREGSGQAR